MYLTNSSLSWLEWLISDPNNKSSNINVLVDNLINLAKDNGSKVIITSFDNYQKGHKHLEKMYRKCGFDTIGSNMSMMAYGITNDAFLSEEFFD